MITLCLLLFTSIQQPAPDSTPPPPIVPIEGWYALDSEDQHDVVLIIRDKEPSSYMIRWFVRSGPDATGVAYRDGPDVVVSWQDEEHRFGLIQYRMEVEKGKPRLVAKRGSKEVLTWLRSIETKSPRR